MSTLISDCFPRADGQHQICHLLLDLIEPVNIIFKQITICTIAADSKSVKNIEERIVHFRANLTGSSPCKKEVTLRSTNGQFKTVTVVQ